MRTSVAYKEQESTSKVYGQNLAIYHEIDRIRRAENNQWVLIRISPHRNPDEILADCLAIRDGLIQQFNNDGEAIYLQMEARGRYIYVKKVNNARHSQPA